MSLSWRGIDAAELADVSPCQPQVMFSPAFRISAQTYRRRPPSIPSIAKYRSPLRCTRAHSGNRRCSGRRAGKEFGNLAGWICATEMSCGKRCWNTCRTLWEKVRLVGCVGSPGIVWETLTRCVNCFGEAGESSHEGCVLLERLRRAARS